MNKIEKAKYLLEKINFWISNGDAKISFILAFSGLFVGFIITSDSLTTTINKYIMTVLESHYWDYKLPISIIVILALLIALTFITISIYHLLSALQASIDSSKYQQTELETNSAIFWGSIATKDYSTFKQDLNRDEDLFVNDIQSQVYINALITTRKFQCYNKGIFHLKISIIAFIVFKTLTFIPT